MAADVSAAQFPTQLRRRHRSAPGSNPLWLLAPQSGSDESFLPQLLDGLDTLSTPVVLILVTLDKDRWPGVPTTVIEAGLHLTDIEADLDPITVATAAPARVVGALTARERTVLHYLPSLMTYEEIASDLYVSVNTVKSHVNGIFRKLGVNGRRQAVRTARDLRLL